MTLLFDAELDSKPGANLPERNYAEKPDIRIRSSEQRAFVPRLPFEKEKGFDMRLMSCSYSFPINCKKELRSMQRTVKRLEAISIGIERQ